MAMGMGLGMGMACSAGGHTGNMGLVMWPGQGMGLGQGMPPGQGMGMAMGMVLGRFCFVLFYENRFGQGCTGPLLEITHLLFGGALSLPSYYACLFPALFFQHFHVFLTLYGQRKNNQPATGSYRRVLLLLFLISL